MSWFLENPRTPFRNKSPLSDTSNTQRKKYVTKELKKWQFESPKETTLTLNEMWSGGKNEFKFFIPPGQSAATKKRLKKIASKWTLEDKVWLRATFNSEKRVYLYNSKGMLYRPVVRPSGKAVVYVSGHTFEAEKLERGVSIGLMIPVSDLPFIPHSAIQTSSYVYEAEEFLPFWTTATSRPILEGQVTAFLGTLQHGSALGTFKDILVNEALAKELIKAHGWIYNTSYLETI